MEDDGVMREYQRAYQAACRYRHALIAAADPYGLNESQAHMLLLIGDMDEKPMKQLTVSLACDPAYTTHLADRLLKQQLVTRTECDKDRRIKLLQLTAKGQRIRRAVINDLRDSIAGT